MSGTVVLSYYVLNYSPLYSYNIWF